MNQHLLSQRPSRPSFTSRTWPSVMLLVGLSACASPVRQGDVDWDNFAQLANRAMMADEALSAARDAKEIEAEELRIKIISDEELLANAPDPGPDSVSEKWHEKEMVEERLPGEREAREGALQAAADFESERRETNETYARSINEHIDGGWKKTLEGALSVKWTQASGAATESQINLTGTRTLPGGGTEPFSGFLTGDGLRTDSSEIGIEYFIADDWAVEVGVTMNNIVRNAEAIDFATLSYDDEMQVGGYVGLKWCPPARRSDGANPSGGRLRPFASLSLGYMDKYALSGTATIPGPDPLEMNMSGDSYSTFGIGVGARYAWTDHIGLEFGVNHVESLSDIEGSWSFTGSGVGGDDYRGNFSTDVSMDRVYFGVVFGF